MGPDADNALANTVYGHVFYSYFCRRILTALFDVLRLSRGDVKGVINIIVMSTHALCKLMGSLLNVSRCHPLAKMIT